MTDDTLYEGREQTLVKHYILEKYLERFAHIIGYNWESITYVDCFSGPWQSQSKEYSDASFAIAIEQLRSARDHLADSNRDFKIRCLFLEKNKKAYRELETFVDQIGTDIEIKAINATLEDSVTKIVEFVRRARMQTFPFIFIDPTGWTGFELDVISPLLHLNPGEVLINFMTGHIQRFLDSPEKPTRKSFEQLFGSPMFRETLKGLTGRDREDAAVNQYMNQVCAVGRFSHASMAMVLNPRFGRSHFHLIYLTRHPKGVEVFKQVEKKAMKEMEAARAKSQQNQRIKKSKQMEMFPDEEGAESAHYAGLRQRYCDKARKLVWDEIQSQRNVPYDYLWSLALRHPMVWPEDLNNWISEWRKSNRITIHGMKPRKKVPKRGENLMILFVGEEAGT